MARSVSIFAQKLTDLYRNPSMSTLEKSVNPSEAPPTNTEGPNRRFLLWRFSGENSRIPTVFQPFSRNQKRKMIDLVREGWWRARPFGRGCSASLGLADYSQVDKLGVRYKFVNFGDLSDGDREKGVRGEIRERFRDEIGGKCFR